MSFLECIISMMSKSLRVLDLPKGDDNELGILGTILDVVRNNGYISEVERSVNLVHEIQRCRLGRKSV